MPDSSERTFEDFKAGILDMIGYDDTGVWETLGLAQAWYPSRLLSERVAIAERVVTELVQEGPALLVRGDWSSFEPVPTSEFDATLRDYRTWDPEHAEPKGLILLVWPSS